MSDDEWIKLALVGFINKIITTLYTYSILLILVLFYPSAIGKTTNESQSQHSGYTPKSERGVKYRMATIIKQQYVDRWIDKLIEWSKRMSSQSSKRRRTERSKRIQWWRSTREMRTTLAFPAVAMSADDKQGHRRMEQSIVNFDTDSEAIGIDNRCSTCISHKIDDFIDIPIESKRTIKGFGGARVSNIMKGTIRWDWSDDRGRKHRFVIPNLYYVHSGGVRLLSPQHWAQTQIRNKSVNKDQIGCDTKYDRNILYWNDRKDTLRVPISSSNNVATFYLAPGYEKFELFCQQANIDYDDQIKRPLICMPVDIDKQEIVDEDIDKMERSTINWPKAKDKGENFDFDMKLEDSRENIIERIGQENSTIESEFLQIHQRYGHISFKRLIEMSRQGIINKRYAKCRIPVCSTCMFAKASRKRWRDKPAKRVENMEVELKPGDRVSIDQLVSPTPGLVAQMIGKLTTK